MSGIDSFLHDRRAVNVLVMVLSIMAIAASVAFVVLFLMLSAQGEATARQGDDLAVAVAKIEALATAQLDERAKNIRGNCRQQNEKNQTTKARLDRSTQDPAARALARSLIDSLAPVEDCVALAERQTRTSRRSATP